MKPREPVTCRLAVAMMQVRLWSKCCEGRHPCKRAPAKSLGGSACLKSSSPQKLPLSLCLLLIGCDGISHLVHTRVQPLPISSTLDFSTSLLFPHRCISISVSHDDKSKPELSAWFTITVVIRSTLVAADLEVVGRLFVLTIGLKASSISPGSRLSKISLKRDFGCRLTYNRMKSLEMEFK